ncbi:MAG: ABC transporter permease [Planctomycetota bacterium]
MTAAWAIVADTWRHSKQQVVFVILIALLLIVAALAIGLPRLHEHEERQLARFGWVFQQEPLRSLEEGWLGLYAIALRQSADQRPIDPEVISEEDLAAAAKEAHEIPLVRRGVEMWVFIAVTAVYIISMLLFLAASSEYFPSLLASGTAEVIVARPLSRHWIFTAKYLGGLVLFAIVLTSVYTLIFAGIGFRTGEWVWRVFCVLPLQMFSAAVLFALIALFGVTFRSTPLSLIVGYFFYLVIDTAVGFISNLRAAGIFDEFPKLDAALKFTEYCPNFGALREIATQSCMSLPQVDRLPIAITGTWGVIAFTLGYLRFRRLDL